MFRSLVAALLVLAAVAVPAQAAHVPTDVQVPKGHKKFLVSQAVGVQIYSCNGTAWSFVAPRADLYDKHGRSQIGTHFAGPTWQTEDGSTVVGARAGGANVDPTAIDWLLLTATPTAPGRLGDTTYIQRINTTGGRAPDAATCNAGTAGTTAEVPYTADYVFWKAR
jgi:opacity protein-like surface antigen